MQHEQRSSQSILVFSGHTKPGRRCVGIPKIFVLNRQAFLRIIRQAQPP